MSTQPPPYAPYAEHESGFQIGLRLLDPTYWIEPDDQAALQFENKAVQLTERHGEVVATADGSEPAQRELLTLLSQYLLRQHPDLYEQDGWNIHLRHVDRTIDLADEKLTPIDRAGRLVQEDLCILQRSPEGHCLTAASVCAPSLWRLADKMGQPMVGIHSPVPGYEPNMSARVERIFGNMKVDQPMWRTNWSVMTEPTLYLPQRLEPSPQRMVGLIAQTAGERLYVRVERQTLRRLPQTGAIVFTIKTYVHPLKAIGDQPELIAGLGRAVAQMTPDMEAYKSLSPIREALEGWIAWRMR